MSQSSQTTTDHETIKQWAEARGGKPATVEDTADGDGAGVIRLMFPDSSQSNDGKLKEISWDEWFKTFDDSKLALLYQEETSDGKESSFNKLVSRD
jgi:hypothetical protein